MVQHQSSKPGSLATSLPAPDLLGKLVARLTAPVIMQREARNSKMGSGRGETLPSCQSDLLQDHWAFGATPLDVVHCHSLELNKNIELHRDSMFSYLCICLYVKYCDLKSQHHSERPEQNWGRAEWDAGDAGMLWFPWSTSLPPIGCYYSYQY